MKIQIQTEWFSLKQAEENPENLYIFGDNLLRVGNGGQAQIRPALNTRGIATKARPGRTYGDYFNDDYINLNRMVMVEDIKAIMEIGAGYDNIVLPIDGFGTGLSELPTRAPETFKVLCELLEIHMGVKTDKNNKLYKD